MSFFTALFSSPRPVARSSGSLLHAHENIVAPPPHWTCVHHCPVDHYSSQFHDHRYSPSNSNFVVSDICLQCRRESQVLSHRLYSVSCSQSAGRSAPELIYLPPNHAMFANVAAQFVHSWGPRGHPTVSAIYVITWTAKSKRSFEQYRNAVETRGEFRRLGFFPGNEQRHFRGADRACTLGEGGNLSPCHQKACKMCEAIRLGFQPHLRRKRNIPLNAGGIRLGAGIYTSDSSSKANQYASNLHNPNSRTRAMLACRVVVGKPYAMYRESPSIRSPPLGYDCVLGKRGWESDFSDDEYVVYNANAIHAAYFILYEAAISA